MWVRSLSRKAARTEKDSRYRCETMTNTVILAEWIMFQMNGRQDSLRRGPNLYLANKLSPSQQPRRMVCQMSLRTITLLSALGVALQRWVVERMQSPIAQQS